MTITAMLGGTFDPVHRGHLELAEAARRFLGLAQLRLVPARVPPHRPTPQASEWQRLQMLQRAVREYPALVVDDRELLRSGPSYSLLTVQELQQSVAGSLPVLVLGWDSFLGLPDWYQWPQLAARAAFLVYARAGHPGLLPDGLGQALQPADFPHQPGQYCVQRADIPEVSATQVRQCVQQGQPINQMVPAAVQEFIESQGLYRAGATPQIQEDN